MTATAELPELSFDTAESWENWLTDRHDSAAGVWLVLAKAGAPQATVSYSDALDVALCFGWIDGRKRTVDASYWLQSFTPRRPRSRWSRINTERADALITAGRMRPAGLREVEAAHADGRWASAYEGAKSATVPDDLAAALAANPAAAAFFATVNSANRFAILYRVQEAKRPATRAARIEKFVSMLARGETIHP